MTMGRDEWLSTKQVTQLYPISATGLWRSRNDKRDPLPYYRIRGRVMYKRRDLDAYFEGKRQSQDLHIRTVDN
jgi:hypothetical protein